MHIELIDLLRCPRNHEESWLVAAFSLMDGRFVIEGTLGCHVCSASYSIVNGVADLRADGVDAGARQARLDAQAIPREAGHARSEEAAMRIAAMLDLSRPGTLAVLEGAAAMESHAISAITQSRIIALDPPRPIDEAETVATVLADERFPFGTATLDGILLEHPARMADAARVLKPGGRLASPAGTALASGFRELARDELYVVAEAAGPLIRLSR